jgi:hypothetical protein
MANLQNNVAATVGQPKEVISAGPKLPLFDEDTDDMGAYLIGMKYMLKHRIGRKTDGL